MHLAGNTVDALINTSAQSHGGLIGILRDSNLKLRNDAFASPFSWHRFYADIRGHNEWVVGENRNQFEEMSDIGQYYKYFPERQRLEIIRNVPVSSYKDGLLWWAESDALAE